MENDSYLRFELRKDGDGTYCVAQVITDDIALEIPQTAHSTREEAEVWLLRIRACVNLMTL